MRPTSFVADTFPVDLEITGRAYRSGEQEWESGMVVSYGYSPPNHGEQRKWFLPDTRPKAVLEKDWSAYSWVGAKEASEIIGRLERIGVSQTAFSSALGWNSTKMGAITRGKTRISAGDRTLLYSRLEEKERDQ